MSLLRYPKLSEKANWGTGEQINTKQKRSFWAPNWSSGGWIRQTEELAPMRVKTKKKKKNYTVKRNKQENDEAHINKKKG